MKTKDIGIKNKVPNKTCDDQNCPFHGSLKLRRRTYFGTVTSSKAHRTATVEWPRVRYIPKYERYEKRRTKIHVHNPECISAEKGDYVKIVECRPLSKTKNFVIIEKFGKNIKMQLKEETIEADRERVERKDDKKEQVKGGQ